MVTTKDNKPEKRNAARIASKQVLPSPALAEIVGIEPLPKAEVTKRVWDYIKVHNLQDPQDKRRIRADRKLRIVLRGEDSVSMFKLPSYVNEHLTGLAGDPVVKPRRSRHLGGDIIVKPRSK